MFWYDPELIGWQQEFEALELPGVAKLTVQNNEFGVKHRITREAPSQKFLLFFRSQAQPADNEIGCWINCWRMEANRFPQTALRSRC